MKEKFNSISHIVGAVLGLVGLLILWIFFSESPVQYIAYGIYGICLILMFSMSATYHGIAKEGAKKILRIFDHSSIFLFIAGTYTPLLLLHLTRDAFTITILVLVWIFAIAGVFFKIVTYKKYDKYKTFSVMLYLAMGWLSVLILPRLFQSVSIASIIFLIGGGILYSVGTIFYRKNKTMVGHNIWHIFVILAALSHYFAILTA